MLKRQNDTEIVNSPYIVPSLSLNVGFANLVDVLCMCFKIAEVSYAFVVMEFKLKF